MRDRYIGQINPRGLSEVFFDKWGSRKHKICKKRMLVIAQGMLDRLPVDSATRLDPLVFNTNHSLLSFIPTASYET